jgi:hypothetical protein
LSRAANSFFVMSVCPAVLSFGLFMARLNIRNNITKVKDYFNKVITATN